MNFNKNNFIFLGVLLINLIFNADILAQKTKDFKWDRPDPVQSIPPEFENSDAVIIFDNVYYSRFFTGGAFHMVDRVHRRIRINSQLGLEENTRIYIPNYKDLRIKYLDARTIKADGRIIDLESKNIKQIGLSEEVHSYSAVSKYLLFAIPGVELGDEIEIYLTYEGESIDRGGNYYFHRQSPVLDAKFTLNVSNDIGLNVRVYNELGACIIEDGIRNNEYKWALKNIEGLYATKGAILPLNLPYLCYELDYSNIFQDSYVSKSDNWAKLLGYLNTELFNLRVRKVKELDAQYERIFRGYDGLSKLEKIKAFHRFMNEEMELTRLEDDEKSYGVEYFLKNNKVDEIFLMGIYKNMLEEMNVKSYLAVAKSRYDGPIDLRFPSVFQVSRLLFVFEDEEQKIHFLIPKDNESSFKLDELPSEIEGTKMYMVNFEDEKDFKEISIPPSVSKYNQNSRKAKSEIKLDEKNIQISVEEKRKGGFYQNAKSAPYYTTEKQQSLLVKELEERIPQSKIKELSYREGEGKQCQIKYKIELENRITKLEKDVCQISIENLFPHQLHELNTNRKLDYFPEYPGVDAYTYYLIFDKNIEILNLENLLREVLSDYASYSLSINQPKPNVLQITSKYILTKSKIPKEGFKDLAEVNKAAKAANSEKLMLRILE